MKKIIFVTGSAGFIGFHLSKLLIDKGNIVIGIDAMTDYYDIDLKQSRLKILKQKSNFIDVKLEILNTSSRTSWS